MIPDAVSFTVLGIALGIFASHATLGNKITRALTQLEGLTQRVDRLEESVPVHIHRRQTDGA